jgi:hypothetical protein
MRARDRWLARGVIAAMALLAGWHLWVFDSNQHDPDFIADDKLDVRPRTLSRVARRNLMSVVNTSFATYHAMREMIPGAHLLIPSDLAAHQFELERVGRLDVEVAPTRLELPRQRVQDIFDHETNELWAMGPGTFTGAVLVPGATRYVLVWRPGDNGLQIIITESRYHSELAAERNR